MICVKCSVDKPATEFYVADKSTGRLRGSCKACLGRQMRQYQQKHAAEVRKYQQAYRSGHSDELVAYHREYRETHREERSQYFHDRYVRDPDRTRGHNLKRQYGLTIAEYDTILLRQGSVCAICGDAQPHSRSRRFHVDHDHATGQVRAILCHPCNIALGCVRDSPEIAEQLAVYLRSFD